VSKPHKKDATGEEKAEESKPYVEFRFCEAKCLKPECKGCGYFWGSGNKAWENQPATWSGPGNSGSIGRPGDLV
jgi:hypothetical protein